MIPSDFLPNLQIQAIHEFTRNDTKVRHWFELFGVISWIAFLWSAAPSSLNPFSAAAGDVGSY